MGGFSHGGPFQEAQFQDPARPRGQTRQQLFCEFSLFAAIRSYTATAGKNTINIYQALVQLAEGNAWLPQPT